jgi:MFS family permease
MNVCIDSLSYNYDRGFNMNNNSEMAKALLVGFITRFSFIFSLQAIPPLFPMLIEEFEMSFTLASSLMWLVAIPGLAISILGGLLATRYGVKSLLTIGLSLCVLSSLLSFSSNTISLFQIGRFILGVGGALAVVSASTLLFQWFEGGKLGMAMGVFGLCMAAGTVAAFNGLGFVASSYGWRFSILVTIIINVLALIICVGLAKEKGAKVAQKIKLEPFKNINIWILGLGWALFNMAALGYTTWGKIIFTRYYDLTMDYSDLLASMLMLGAFIQPLTGFISDMLGKRRVLIIFSCTIAFAIFLLFPYSTKSYFLPLALALGLATAFVPPTMFALSGEILGPGKGALGFGILNTFLNVAIIFGPLSVGYVLDITDSNNLSFITLAIFSLSASFLAIRAKC